MNILVTGGCGFIGSNFIKHLINSGEYNIINIDALTYAGNPENLRDIEGNPNYKFMRGDICDRDLVNWTVRSNEINYIVNFAAETHVDRSILEDIDFIRTNVEGTRVLLDCALKYNIKKFIQIGTDEVYGSLKEEDKSSKETDPTKPSNPYSASKLGADALALSYFITYCLPVCITRSSNNYGPYQFPEKIIPLFITNLLEGEKVPLYGEGRNIRDWIYVADNCSAVKQVLDRGKPGEIYNIGGGNEIRNIDLTRMILEKMGFEDNWIGQVEFIEDRKGHDWRYSMNCNKIQNANFGWRPEMPFDIGLQGTIEWYKKNEQWWKKLKRKK